MKVTDYFLKAAGKPLVSFEILPPLKGGSIDAIFKVLDPLMEFKPPFIDVTYHREEFLYKKRESGYFEKFAMRKRPGTVGICAAIMNKYGVDAVPHLICGGFSTQETEDALIDLSFLGIDNVLVIRGDARKFDGRFIPEKDGHPYALNLVEQVVKMNSGEYLDPSIQDGVQTNLCIGVAGYPEKHFEAPNIASDLFYLKKKIEAGANYIVTQMFFDNQKFFKFVKACRDYGINVPIIPGLKPLTKKRQMAAIPRIFHVDIPEDLAEAIRKCKNDKAVTEVGIEWCRQQSKELLEFGVPCLHYYTMSDVETVKAIVSDVL